MENTHGRYGYFELNEPATYVITSREQTTSWEYIYQNADMLLKVDQNGPVYAQAYPPRDILLFRRDRDETYSKWLVFFISPEVNGGKPFTNFFRPVLSDSCEREPENLKITFSPHCAQYSFEIDGLTVSTELLVPLEGSDIVMRTTVCNHSGHSVQLTAVPSLVPHINPAQLAPWDKPEWYLKTGFGMEENAVFFSRLFSSESLKEKRRCVTMWMDREGLTSADINLERFTGCGDICHPQGIYADSLSLSVADSCRYGEYFDANTLYGYPQVYAGQYQVRLEPGRERTFTQVLSLQPNSAEFDLPDLNVAKIPARFLEETVYLEEKKKLLLFYRELFSKRSLKTDDSFFNYYVNSFLELQMHWVASLDRGWPTGMRGTRDCSNDFMGVLSVDGAWAKKELLGMYSCQRSDGWFPRQFSTSGKYGKHDLREYVDGGVFAVEFLYEYLCQTGDREVLKEPTGWLDTEEISSMLDHMLRAVEYYRKPENIGEHGLCKIRGGDWLDAVNRAGLEGRGETVMVTCQLIMALEYTIQILTRLNIEPIRIQQYRKDKEQFKAALQKYAWNKKGFFNSVFTDGGNWLFSDSDPDGESRVYIPANAYAIISGVADAVQTQSIFENIRHLKTEMGYRLFWPALGGKPMGYVGRIGSGDVPPGFMENGNPYNHGAHGFLARAFAAAGDGEQLYDTLQYMLPFDQQRHPTDKVKTPPYAVVNCWQQIPGIMHRGGMTFLTGSIAMAERAVYTWMAGIRPLLGGIALMPCLPRRIDSVTVNVYVRGRNLTIHLKRLKKMHNRVTVDGKEVTDTITDAFSGREISYIPDGLFHDHSQIECF